MGSLLYFAAFAGFFFLMMRFGCGSHIMGHGHAQHIGHGVDPPRDRDGARSVPPKTAVDPVA